MARIHLPERPEMTPEQQTVFDTFPANLTRALLRTSASAKAYVDLGNSFRKGTLEAELREAVILRVSVLSNSAYEKMQHLKQASAAGISEEIIHCIEAGKFNGLPPKYQGLLRFVDECVSNGKVSDEVFLNASALFSETDLADITLLTGHYMMTARFLETLEVDLDTESTSFPDAK